jgi:hypothetical protein
MVQVAGAGLAGFRFVFVARQEVTVQKHHDSGQLGRDESSLCSGSLGSLPMPPTNHHVTSNPTANSVFAGCSWFCPHYFHAALQRKCMRIVCRITWEELDRRFKFVTNGVRHPTKKVEPFAAYVLRLRLCDSSFGRIPKNHLAAQLYSVELSSLIHVKVEETLQLPSQMCRIEAIPRY